MKKNLTLLCLMVFIFSGCATKVERVDRGEKIDLSGRWNDYDAKLVSEEIIADVLDKSWRNRFIDENGRLPVVIVGSVDNRTSEHINTQVITKFMESELLDSGDVVFVASSTERTQIRTERDDQQQGHTDPSTMATLGKERGADFMLIGSINSVEDVVRRKEVIFYQVSLELINLSTNQKIWIGQKEIKKKIKNPRVSL